MINKFNVRAMGDFFPQDESGEIINPTRFDLIPPHWRPAIQKVKEAYFQFLGAKIHSIWLRGSVPRGFVVDGLADLDTFVLIKGAPGVRWQSVDFESQLEQEIKNEFPFIAGVEARMCGFEPDLAKVKPKIAMLIRTQSLCLCGDDIREGLPAYAPGKEMMLNYRWLKSDLKRFTGQKEPDVASIRAIAKIFIRVGYELVMERLGRYTNDLYLCYQGFAHFYPEKEPEMLLMLKLFVNPLGVSENIKKEITQFGHWLEKEVKRVIK